MDLSRVRRRAEPEREVGIERALRERCVPRVEAGVVLGVEAVVVVCPAQVRLDARSDPPGGCLEIPRQDRVADVAAPVPRVAPERSGVRRRVGDPRRSSRVEYVGARPDRPVVQECPDGLEVLLLDALGADAIEPDLVEERRRVPSPPRPGRLRGPRLERLVATRAFGPQERGDALAISNLQLLERACAFLPLARAFLLNRSQGPLDASMLGAGEPVDGLDGEVGIVLGLGACGHARRLIEARESATSGAQLVTAVSGVGGQMGRSMWFALALFSTVGCTDGGDNTASDESDSDTDSDTDTDTDTDSDTDTDTTTPIQIRRQPSLGRASTSYPRTDRDPRRPRRRRRRRSVLRGRLRRRWSSGRGSAAVFRADGGDTEVGQMAVALGPFPADVNLQDAWLTIDGEGEQSHFGISSVAIPDLDGDGADELLVAAPGIGGPSSPTDPASVYLFAGLAPGALTLAEADVTYVGETEHDALGVAMAAADLDGDGTADLVLGAPYRELHNYPRGAVYGIDGTALETEPEDAPLRIYGEHGSAGGYFGVSVTALGDVDGDGADDLAIAGGPGISIFHGPLSGAMLASDGDATIDSDDLRGPAGLDRARGRRDGDGVTDLLVGWYYEAAGPGAAWLFDGTRLDKGETAHVLADWKLEGVSTQMLGYQVASAGDVDGDDRADVLVSAPGDAEWGSQAGAVFYFRGPLSGADEPADQDASFHGDTATMAGRSMVPAVDVTGDGRRDLLFGAPGIKGWKGGNPDRFRARALIRPTIAAGNGLEP